MPSLTPLVIGGVVAAASIAQDNYGGAVAAVLIGGAISLIQHLTQR
ncbi:MAG TPA: hypothetical protein VFP72_06450 [Kineosporiaceae bacterium]|nr:hypothetical protein [Kineosporiaceae bacterium]